MLEEIGTDSDEPDYYMEEVKKRLVKTKCMADMFVWLGFEYERVDDGYLFERSYKFDIAWKNVHTLRQYCRK